MNNFEFANNSLDKEYLEHEVFSELENLKEFYDSLSNLVMHWLTTGTIQIINIDSRMFSSMKGTIESIHDILKKGRINDAYSLLRKFYDLVIINLYTNLFLDNNITIDNFINNKINDWLKGKEKIPGFEKMSEYIIKSESVQELTKLIYNNGQFKGSTFEELRQRCNEHTHYFYFHNLLSNDNEIHSTKRVVQLNEFLSDLRAIFILHFSYLFSIKQNYMMSSDYIDYSDCNLEPPENCQYWVAPFIQEKFDNIIKKYRPDISNLMIEKTSMELK